MAAILNSANLNSTILDSAILVFPLKLTHTCQDWLPPFPPPKKKLPSLFPLHHLHKILHSFNLINLMMTAILNSAILDSAILHKTLTQTNSIWLKLIHSHSTWLWQPSWILPSCIQPFCTKKLHSFILTQLDDGGHLEFCHLAFNHFAQNYDSNSFILSQLDDGSHLELCHLGFTHFAQNSDSN